jgi:hypothetical protein
MANKITKVQMADHGWVREDGLEMPSINVFIFPDTPSVILEDGRAEVWLWDSRPIPDPEPSPT